jgi:hypothetical protein
MSTLQRLSLCLVTVIVIAINGITVGAQTVQPTSKSDSITVSITIDKDHLPVGQSPWILLTMNNKTDHELVLHFETFRLHIEGGKGEAPTKLRQRMSTGKLLPGESTLRGDENVPMLISAGMSRTQKFNVKYFYDLSVPGTYTVYMDVKDPLSQEWLRTNTLNFEVQEASQ